MGARIGGYVVDMVIFAAVAMIVTVAAGMQLLVVTRNATADSDPAIYAFLIIIAVGTPLAWTALNLCVLYLRKQTGGQYVAGIRLIHESDGPLSARQLTAWWFCFNPLLFSWPMTLVTGLPIAFVIFLLLSRITLFVWSVVITLGVACPIIALVSALFDPQHRTLHDRIVGTVAVPVE